MRPASTAVPDTGHHNNFEAIRIAATWNIYLLRDFNLGSVYSLFGFLLCLGGLVFGLIHWVRSAVTGEPATSGTVMLAAFLMLVGIQLLIAFLHHDVSHVPTEPLALELGDDAGLTPGMTDDK